MSLDDDDEDGARSLADLLLADPSLTGRPGRPVYYELSALLRIIRDSLVIDEDALKRLIEEQIKAQAEKVNLEVIVRDMVKHSVFEFVNDIRHQVSQRVRELIAEAVDKEFCERVKEANAKFPGAVTALVNAMLKGNKQS